MIVALMVVLASATAYACCGPWLGRTLRPATAVRLLTPAAVLVTAALWFAAAVAAFTWIGQDAATGRAARRVVLFGDPGSLVVLDSDMPDAFTTPEATGRIVVTRGMLRALPADERAALLAHERSHLSHRHAWWATAADLAARANPTLVPTARTLRNAVERWADEDAAARLGDRRLVARALARAALARQRHPRDLLPATWGSASARVAAPARPARRPARAAAPTRPPTRRPARPAPTGSPPRGRPCAECSPG